MKVTRAMLHPALRLRGTLIRLLWPPFTVGRLRFCARLMPIYGRFIPKPRWAAYRELSLPRGDGSALRLCVYAPKTPAAGAVGLLWLHGGGYAMGLPEQEGAFIRRFVEEGCVVVAPDYRRSADAPYPAALEDCYLALLWLKEHGAEYGVAADRLFAGGDSAGGGLTAALCLYARDRGEVSLAFQMPLYPMLDDRMASESMRGNDAPVWNEPSTRAAWELYLGGAFGAEDVPKYASPARETDLCGLPPALTFVGGVDPFRDETLAFIERLSAAGVPASCRVFEGCFHAFDLFGSVPIAREAVEYLMEGFRYAAAHYRKPQP